MASDADPVDLATRRAPSASVADEWSLVLAAAGIPSRVVRTPGGFVLEVARADAERAEGELAAHAADQRATADARARARRAPAEAFEGPAPRAVASATAIALVAFHGVTGPARADAAWFVAGRVDAAAIRAGELWRSVTALCLHADLAHLAANVLFGTIVLAFLARAVGPGLALALVVVSGAGGNLVNAFLRSAAHLSVGASTAVFGGVGVLTGLAIARRAHRGERWVRVLAPFAAGLGLLAMTGSGEGRVDVFAHLFGWLVGLPLGVLTGRVMQRPPGPALQTLAAGATALAVAGSWRVALG